MALDWSLGWVDWKEGRDGGKAREHSPRPQRHTPVLGRTHEVSRISWRLPGDWQSPPRARGAARRTECDAASVDSGEAGQEHRSRGTEYIY